MCAEKCVHMIIHCTIGMRKPRNSVIDIREKSFSEIVHCTQGTQTILPLRRGLLPCKCIPIHRMGNVLISQAAIMKKHRQGGLKNKCFFFYDSGGQKSKIEVSAGLVSFQVSLLGLYMTTFSLSLHLAFPLYMFAS